MDLKELKKVIPHKWRVQSFSKFKPQASCVSYIDARSVMEILDEIVGAENWKDEYKAIDNKLFAGISIKINDEWVCKWDTGSESNIEKEKGQVSDSFKRAGVKWGIGRFLYDLKIQYVKANVAKTASNVYPYCVDNDNQRIWDLDKHFGSAKKAPQTPPVNVAPKKAGKEVLTIERLKTAIYNLLEKGTIKFGAKDEEVIKHLEEYFTVSSDIKGLIQSEISTQLLILSNNK